MSVSAANNPASVYCRELGYDTRIAVTKEGQKGMCVFPDGSECEEWAFLDGECGQEYSYCVKIGYDIKAIKTDDGFSKKYAVCVPKNVFAIFPELEQKPVLELIGLKLRTEIPEHPSKDIKLTTKQDFESLEALPDYFDWRDKDGINWITPIKDQGSCDSCWSFSAIGSVEAQINIDLNYKVDSDLSEQEVVSDCCDYCGDCNGGENSDALRYIDENGIADEDCFPYITDDSACNQCQDSGKRKTTTGYPAWFSTFNQTKQALVEQGPLSLCFEFYEDFYGYNEGIYKHDESLEIIDGHCVVLVGYNDTGNYFIIKNSWGTWWGMDGYVLMDYGEFDIGGYTWPRKAVDINYDPDGHIYVCENLGNYIWINKGGGCNCYGDDSDEQGTYELTETSCLDNADNDCDGLIDNSDPDCIKTFNITLNQAWNLISFPLNLTNKTIKNVFKGINFSSVFSYGSWFYYYNETFNNFNKINESKGYWINSLEYQILTVEGTEFESVDISLEDGWNLIGWPSLNITLINESFDVSKIDLVMMYNNSEWYSYSPNKPDNLNNWRHFYLGYGYWVKK